MQQIFAMLTREHNVTMQYELAAMLCLLALPALMIKDRRKLAAAWAAVFLFFIYIHRILLPFIISGVYVLLLAGAVSAFVTWSLKGFLLPVRLIKKWCFDTLERSFVPYAAVIVIILLIQLCRINVAVDYDSLRYGLRSDVLLTGGKGIRGFFENTGLVNSVYVYPKGFELITRPLYFGHTYGYVLCVNIWVLIAALIAVGEMSVLVSGSAYAGYLGIMLASLVPGITNMSVTAKSDHATLLCQLGFIYCVMRYMGCGTGGGSAAKTSGSSESEQAGARTAKDSNLGGKYAPSEACLTGTGLASLILSYSFKPTAVIFSSLVGLTGLACLLVRKKKICFNACGLRALVPAAAFTAVVTLRTCLITGMPFSSVFTGLQEKIGFSLNYPFFSQSILYDSGNIAITERIKAYIVRFFSFLICPAGEDMAHVIMAWGGVVFLVALIYVIGFGSGSIRRMEELNRLYALEGLAYGGGAGGTENGGKEIYCRPSAYCALLAMLIAVGITSAVTLGLLYQVDGNYYMLLYSLTVVAGTAILSTGAEYEESILWNGGTGRAGRDGIGGNRTESGSGLIAAGLQGRLNGSIRFHVFSGGSNIALILLAASMIYVTAFTSWMGDVGFTPVDFINRGYYNHEVETGVFNPLGWDNDTRVTAFAEEPGCYRLKGRVESWVDLDGSGGNNMITDTKLNLFKEYLSFADIDYIYADTAYINDASNERRLRAGTLFKYLLDDGCFEELTEDGAERPGCIFARIDKERVAVGWETTMGKSREERTKKQQEWYADRYGEY